MKIRIELDDSLIEEEVVIHCRSLSEEVQKIQKAIAESAVGTSRFVFYKGDTQYYLSLEDVLFFETEEKGICAHTIDNIYQVKYRLYELEETLPRYFIRVSKSSILNTNKVYSINRSLSSVSVVEFQNTHKQVYVSRYYYKLLKNKLEERRK